MKSSACWARLPGWACKRVRITGGEPLLRRDLPTLAARIANLPGIEDLSLSTNATQMDKHAAALKAVGVTRLNVSLDSLQAERIEAITGRDVLHKIMAGLISAQQAGFTPIKINMVAMRGVNDDEIDAMVAFCMERNFVLRLIEAMPMGDTGRNTQYLDLQPVKARIQARFGLVDMVFQGGGPARYLGSPDGQFMGNSQWALSPPSRNIFAPPATAYAWPWMARSTCAWGRKKNSSFVPCCGAGRLMPSWKTPSTQRWNSSRNAMNSANNRTKLCVSCRQPGAS